MFVHPLLLGGLLLVGIPVLIHLTMRQKPKRLRFPALRFLQQRHVSNARSLRLRHLLLLGLRILLVALACLALAHPRLLSGGLFASSDRAVAAVLVFDTSYSMEYTVAGQTRLAEAQRRADELLAELPEGSRVAILDTSDPGEDWEPSVGEARRKVAALELCYARPRLGTGNATVSSQLARAYRLFGKLDQEGDEAAGLPQVLHVFSDRTRACWDASEIKDLERPEKVRMAFLDVGVEQPRDLAIVSLDVQPGEVLLPETTARFQVKVRAAANPADHESYPTEVRFRLRSEPNWTIQSGELRPGKEKTFTFTVLPKDLHPGFNQAEVQLGPNDALTFNNMRFATFEVRESRRVLVLSDTKKDAFGWTFDLNYLGLYQCDVKVADEVGALSKADLQAYPLVCVVRFSEPNKHLLWTKLGAYAADGGRVIVVPGGEDWQPEDSYRGKDATARQFLPAALEQPIAVPREAPGVTWARSLPRHPLLEPFRQWQRDDGIDFQQEGQPRATGYWAVKPLDAHGVIVTYADPESHPALVERTVGKGRVLLFTTPFEDRRDPFGRQWNNYAQSSFSRVLINLAANYLTGESERPPLNVTPGQRVTIPLPPGPRAATYTLTGPGIAVNESIVTRGEDQDQLLLDQAVLPGNYTVYDGQARQTVGAFSINSPAAESQLERVDSEEISRTLGPDAVVPIGRAGSVRDLVADRLPQSVDLFPWLMIGLLLLLAVENLLSNRFYGRASKEGEVTVAVPMPKREEQATAVPAGRG